MVLGLLNIVFALSHRQFQMPPIPDEIRCIQAPRPEVEVTLASLSRHERTEILDDRKQRLLRALAQQERRHDPWPALPATQRPTVVVTPAPVVPISQPQLLGR